MIYKWKMTFIKLYLIIQYENKGWELHPRQHPNIFHGKLGSRYRKPTSTAVRTKWSVFIFVLSHYYKTGFIISYLVSSSLFSRYELKAMDLDVNDTFLFHADRFVVYLFMWLWLKSISLICQDFSFCILQRMTFSLMTCWDHKEKILRLKCCHFQDVLTDWLSGDLWKTSRIVNEKMRK